MEFCRVIFRSEVQRQGLVNYLLAPERTAEELQGFASVFPNANMAVSKNLLTNTLAIDGRDLAARDRKSLEQVEQWLGDPRFVRVHPILKACHNRIIGFLKSN